MSRMIEDMLDLARARLAGGIPLSREPSDLGVLVHRVVQEHQVASPDRRIESSSEGDLTGDWDADRLAQVASNLIGNALQHGGPDDVVTVRLQGLSDGAVVFSVANTGTIPADLLPHIFDPFRGGERPLRRGNGLGLGLYIVQQIVLAHRGSIEARSADGRTVFHVTIPRRTLEAIKL